MLEIEQKFRLGDFGALEQRLTRLDAQAQGEVVEVDQYFNAPDRDFSKTREAFRLRRVGSDNYLTYKGPRAADAVKTRTELELPLLPGEEPAASHAELLRHLGYRPVAVVRKRRRTFHLDRAGFSFTICLDEVDDLGRFAEVEVLAGQAQLESARAVLIEVAHDLGLSDVEPRAYLTMILQSAEAGA
jgi:adenylate cyclase class 2